MVRGPRRAPAERRIERKVAQMMEQSHGGFEGQSILDMLRAHLIECCRQYRTLKEKVVTEPDYPDDHNKLMEARGRIRGVAIAVALMRHPLRRYETSWWNYVKKIEKQAMVDSRATL